MVALPCEQRKIRDVVADGIFRVTACVEQNGRRSIRVHSTAGEYYTFADIKTGKMIIRRTPPMYNAT